MGEERDGKILVWCGGKLGGYDGKGEVQDLVRDGLGYMVHWQCTKWAVHQQIYVKDAQQSSVK